MAKRATTTKSDSRSKSMRSSTAASKSTSGKTAQSVAETDTGHTHGHCSMPHVAPRNLPSDMNPLRSRLIIRNGKKWANHTILHYCFLDDPSHWRGSEDDKDAVRASFKEWKDVPIGLDFVEVSDPTDAEIRIGFFHHNTAPDAGSWSYVGRDTIDVERDPTRRTMNFGWSLTDSYGRDTALHEIGHAIGFPHEHQNPNAGIIWDEPAVLAYYAGAPNFWNESTTRHNILNKLDPSEVDGSGWDPNSIMHYWVKAGLILEPAQYRDTTLLPEPGLSAQDIEAAKELYPAATTSRPPELRPFQAHQVDIEPGEQLDFIIEPTQSRRYTLQTFGMMDTVMVLFEEFDGEPRYLAGDDDSGQDYNAKIEQRLLKGKTYYVRLRLYFSEAAGGGALMMY